VDKIQVRLCDYLATFLAQKEITHVFELAGGMITNLLDSIQQKTQIKIISMHHEQSAAFAADAFGRFTNKPGIAFATSGPGATNLLTGIGSCYFDSVPAIFITGQVNTHELKQNKNIRQLGFQETDIISIAKPLTKAAFQITNPNLFPEILESAFQISTTGRPGPVLIDIPLNIQRAPISSPSFKKNDAVSQSQLIATPYELIINKILSAKKPLILAGRGLRASSSLIDFKKLISKIEIPVCQSLLGLDCLDYQHPLRVGFFGSYGNRWANEAIAESDLLFVLGARLDIRQTGANVDILSNKEIIHVDCETGELNNRVKTSIPIEQDLLNFLTQINNYIEKNNITSSYKEWLTEINLKKNKSPDTSELTLKHPDDINPNEFMHILSKYNNENLHYSVDVGAHQMWAAQSIELKIGQQFLTSGGMGAMGYSLPAAIGGTLASQHPFIVITGDGSLQLNIQELQTIVRNQLPIKIVVLNNQCLGMIRQFQDSYFSSRYQSTVWGYSTPDFQKVAEAYGIHSKTIHNKNEVIAVLDWAFSKEMKNSPSLIQVMIKPDTAIYPKIAFGRPLHEMEPLYKPNEMEGT